MDSILTTLLPIFILIMLGYWFKWTKFPSPDFWPMADKFTYYVLMPALLVYKLSSTHIEISQSIDMVASALISITVVFFALMGVNYFVRIEPRAFTSVMQGGIRFNSYVLLAFVDSLYGDKGLVMAAIIMAFVIPYINVLCISTFAIYTQKGNFSLRSFVKTIITNPLILACILGGGINAVDFAMPVAMVKSLGLLSAAALPVGLLSVGVGLEFKYLKNAKKELFVSTFAKLVFFPFVAFCVATVFALSGMTLSIVIVFAAMPTAVSGYILARELGGDTTLMASIITLETLACILPLFLLLPLF